jgi:hypothetical protein
MLRQRLGTLFALFAVLMVVASLANGQVTSITINGAPTTMSTGAFAGLQAVDQNNKPVLANWSSSNPAAISVNNVGVATAVSGTVNPVTITATSGSVSGTAQITSVSPQTTLFASNGSNLSVYDITLHQAPSLVTTVTNYAGLTDGGENGQNSIAMAIGPGPNSTEQYLFIANPAYQTTNAADFVITVIDTTTYRVVTQINTGLCYPTSLAVAALSPANATTAGNNYLYVVNAGPSVAQGTPVSCTGANVQYYDISQISNQPWTPAGALTSSSLEGSSGVTGAVPLVVAASSDQTDGLVYVGSTANYSSSGNGTGLLTSVLTGTTTIEQASKLSFSSGAVSFAISPIALTVITAYPSWNNGAPVHTAFMTGPGYNTSIPNAVPGTVYDYVSDACQSTPCSTQEPLCLYCLTGGGGPNSYSPWVLAKSPDGLNVYAADDEYYLDQLVSADGTSSTGFFFSNYFTTNGTNVDTCVGVCLPITSVTTNADESNVFVGFIGQINRLNPSTLDSDNTLSSVSPLSLIATQHPEFQLNPQIQISITSTGTTVTNGTFTVNGNFQNPESTNGGYAFSCNWGETSFNSGNLWQSTLSPPGPTGGTISPNLPTYQTGTSASVSITPAVVADANGNSGSIIVPIPIGPITTQIVAQSLTVQLGATDQVSAQVSPPLTDQTVTWEVNSSVCTTSGSGCPFGTINSSGLYTAPTTPPSGTVPIEAIPNADPSDSSAVSNVINLTITFPIANVSPENLTFSGQNVGTTSAAQPVKVTNTGTANLVLGATPASFTGADPSDFSIASGTTCTGGLSIVPSSSCTILVAFTPSTTGTLTANLIITDNSGGISGATQNVSLTGMGTAPTANVTPSSLTFSTQDVGTTSASQKVTVTNTGGANLVLGATPVTLSGADPGDYATASGTTCTANLSIAPSANCMIEVTFSPTTTGTLTANLVITDNSGGTSGTTQTVTLTGTGQQLTPTASVSPSSLTFSVQNVGTTSAAQKVTVTNTGTANLVLAATPVSISGTDPSDYAIATGTTCIANLSIAPNSSCAIQVTFSPSTTGTLTANLVITDNSGGTSGTTQTVTLTGTGQQPGTGTASISPTSLTFSAQNLGTTSAAQKVTVTNTGTANLVLAATPVSISGSHPSDYATASSTTCTANLSIAPSANCIIEVTFSPTTTGTLTANLVITDNSGGTSGTTQTVTLTGTGQQPTPTASVSPSSLTFSVQNVGTTSAAQKVTVTNTGTANLVLAATPVSISGTDPSDYAIATGTTCTANLSIAPNSSCAIQVTFSPSTTGTLTANLVITDNSGGTSGTTQTVSLKGTGLQPTGTASVNPSSLTFATQNVGATSSPKSITVTNTGQANLVLGATAATITGAASDYAIASGTTCTANLSIAPNSSCVFQITFSPLEAGTLTANLVITDNSGGSAGTTQTVSLTGTGFQPITVAIYPANPAVQAGATQQFTPNFAPSSAAGPVTWSVSGSGCRGQACGSINATGLYTAPATLSVVATDTVTVTLNSNTSVTNSTQVDLYLQPILSTSGASQTVVAGQPATYNLTLASGTGDTATTLMIECHQNTLPTGVSCPPVTVQPSSSGASFTLVVDTTAGQDASLLNGQWGIHLALLLPCCVLLSLAGARKGVARGKNLLPLMLSLLVVVCLVSFSACGTNGTFGTTTQKSFNGTPSGTYTIEIDGVGPSGVPQSIGTVSLTVQ